MAERVEFEGASGKVGGALATPPGDGKAAAVILFPEWWGLNGHIESLVDRLASAGFLVLAIDVYEGKITKDAAEAGALMGALDFGKAVGMAKAARAWLAAHPRGNGKVGAIGFCMGGALTFASACAIPELGAAVPFYGIPDPAKLDLAAVRAPILAHFSRTDQWAKPELAEGVRATLAERGHPMTLEVYDAEHAFVNDTRPEVYSKVNAELAWQRSVDFLHANLG